MQELANPFLVFRDRLDSFATVRDGRMSDEQFVAIVETLDEQLVAVDGVGFCTTPLAENIDISAVCEIDAQVVCKIETGNVGDSHKARHLFGTALHLLVDVELGTRLPERLAIASCGNAAVGASIVAAAMKLPIDVFVPQWADAGVVDRVLGLGATVNRCERRDGEAGDPAYLRFREAVAEGAFPFSVQGTDNPHAFDGGRTLGWELSQQAPDLDAVYVQVGGGALATAVSLGLGDGVALRPVQAEGCAPLDRAWQALRPEFNFEKAAAQPERYMYPWDGPASAATGILDDLTYDWLPLLERTHATGGVPVVAEEATILDAHARLAAALPTTVSATGTAGVAGLLTDRPKASERVAVILTGKY